MSLTVAAAFMSGGLPATGLALAEIGLWLTAANRATGAQTVVWDGSAHPTAEVTGLGVYLRIYDSEDLGTYNYFAGARYSGATAVDAAWIVGSAGESVEAIADGVLKRDIDQVEVAAAKHSLGTAVLKSVSKVRDNGDGQLETFMTDGVTVKLTQDIATDDALDPLSSIGVGV